MHKVSAEEAKKKVKVQNSLFWTKILRIYISIYLTERFQIVRLGLGTGLRKILDQNVKMKPKYIEYFNFEDSPHVS